MKIAGSMIRLMTLCAAAISLLARLGDEDQSLRGDPDQGARRYPRRRRAGGAMEGVSGPADQAVVGHRGLLHQRRLPRR